jgi:hypothetical protein
MSFRASRRQSLQSLSHGPQDDSFTCKDTKIDNSFPLLLHLHYAPYQELCRPIASFGEAMFCAPSLGEWFERPIKESDLDIESDLVIVIKESAPSTRQLEVLDY